MGRDLFWVVPDIRETDALEGRLDGIKTCCPLSSIFTAMGYHCGQQQSGLMILGAMPLSMVSESVDDTQLFFLDCVELSDLSELLLADLPSAV